MKKTKPVLRFKLNKDLCKGCGLCIEACPVKNLEFSTELNRRGVKYAKIKDIEKCKGCGFCFLVCPDTCIEISYEK